jgi:WD40 repeat protein/class 3 adenylate cyclase
MTRKRTERPHRRTTERPLASRGISLVQGNLSTDDWIARVHWSPSGHAISAASRHGFSVWDSHSGHLRFRHSLEALHIYNAAWSPNGNVIATTASDNTVNFWNADDGRLTNSIEVNPPKSGARTIEDEVRGFAWSPDGLSFAVAGETGVSIWDTATVLRRTNLEGSLDSITVCWSPDGEYIACSTYLDFVQVWKSRTGELVHRFPASYGPALAWSPDSRQLACANEQSVTLWDIGRGVLSNVLEGHTQPVRGLAFSADGRLLASREGSRRTRATERRVIIWRTDTWEAVGAIKEASSWYLYAPLAFSPVDARLATSGKEDQEVHIWDLTELLQKPIPLRLKTTFYRNAKVALLGDSGVGKTGLSLVLSNQPFAATESTHGRTICMLDSHKVKLGPDCHEIRELVLWDLAGQPGYRLVHQLHLEDLSLTLILFDARNELDPFSGIMHWHRAIEQAKRHTAVSCREVLVAARIDRGSIGVSEQRINSFLKGTGIAAYVKTSAKDGSGVTQLNDLIRRTIDWESVPRISSNAFFQKIRKFILEEKQAGHVLSNNSDLLRRFSLSSKHRRLSQGTLRGVFKTCINRLQTLGLVHKFSFGDLVLLRPELLDAYASSIIFAAKEEPDGMGSIAEDTVRLGKFRIPDEQRLQNPSDEKLLLLATIEDLIRHEIALREPANDAQLLVFPSQLTRENPDLPDPPGKACSIAFEGAVLNIYATLVVRLSHSGVFRKREMWKNAALFTTSADSTCGLFLTEIGEGRGRISLFFGANASPDARSQFEEYVHNHILRRAVPQSVSKSRVIVCPDASCATPVSDLAVQRRRDRGHHSMECNVCGMEISLKESAPSADIHGITAQIDRIATAKRLRESALISASGEMRAPAFSQWVGSNLSTLALVFTDVVGSTALAAELGDEQMGVIRRAHFTQGRALIKKYNGNLIKTIGDSLMAAFRTATEALDFSLAFRLNTGHVSLRIKVGIHVGPVEIEEEDAFGSMVNYAARIVSCAKPSEICVSDRSRADIVSRRAETHSSLQWQAHRVKLKGFNDEQLIWSIPIDGG